MDVPHVVGALTANLAALLVGAVPASVLARADDVEGAAVAVLAPEQNIRAMSWTVRIKHANRCASLSSHACFYTICTFIHNEY